MKQTILNFITKACARREYSLIPNWKLSNQPQATYLRRLFDYCNINTVIDVGANEGQYRDFLRDDVRFDGKILSIEPTPGLAIKLRKRAELDKNWEIRECALSSTSGTATLNVMNGNQFSSLLQPSHDEPQYFARMNAVSHTVTVKTETLRETIQSLDDASSRNIYLKLDTQGFDVEILKGSQDALHMISALQTEAAFKRIYQDAPNYSSVIEFLERSGFNLSGIYQNNEGHFPALIEMDFHFISQKLIPKHFQTNF